MQPLAAETFNTVGRDAAAAAWLARRLRGEASPRVPVPLDRLGSG